MEIIGSIKEKINRARLKKVLVLPEENIKYSQKIQELKEKIINSIPTDLDDMEKAYYIYIELGKALNEDPINVFGVYKDRERLHKKKIEDSLEGNCKAIAELYVQILRDERVGIRM